MALGILPAILGAATAVAPVVFQAVDQHQQRKREKKERKREAMAAAVAAQAAQAGSPTPPVLVPVDENPVEERSAWLTPLVAAGASAGAVSYLLLRYYKKPTQARIAGVVTLGLTGVLVYRSVRRR